MELHPPIGMRQRPESKLKYSSNAAKLLRKSFPVNIDLLIRISRGAEIESIVKTMTKALAWRFH